MVPLADRGRGISDHQFPFDRGIGGRHHDQPARRLFKKRRDLAFFGRWIIMRTRQHHRMAALRSLSLYPFGKSCKKRVGDIRHDQA